ncbi:MAG: ATP-binding cassette domain-containing protein [Myxococcota bacterium]
MGAERAGPGAPPGLVLRFDGALGNLRLDVQLASGARRIAIVGPSGAGKSTCLRILAGLEHPTGAEVRFAGESWLGDGGRCPPWERGVGWVPQDALLFPHRKVRDNLRWAGRATPSELHEVAEWLEVTPLLDRRPRNLSGGERKRVALGRALLSAPRLLLLDEPFAALDPAMRDRVATSLRRYCDERGLPLVLVSHDSVDLHVLGVERWRLEGGCLRLEPGSGELPSRAPSVTPDP